MKQPLASPSSDELIFSLLFIVLFVLVIILIARSFKKAVDKQEAEDPEGISRPYVSFENLILRSYGGNTPHTEIDQVIVSQYGIFCIEEKSHAGSIYGNDKAKEWYQYLRGEKYPFFNPLRQNYKHTQALKDLIGYNLRAPIHSYVIFPNAHAVKIGGGHPAVFTSYGEMWDRIEKHTTLHYSPEEYGRILKTLAYASTKKDELIGQHIYEVNEYLLSKK